MPDMSIALFLNDEHIETIALNADGSIVFHGETVSILDLSLRGYSIVISI
jgi:hypothetical protein